MRRKLSDVANLVTRKVRPEGLSYSNYISTDSMKSNLGGVEFGKSNVPTGKATLYKPGDVLFSNIRTYFRKVWRANCFGSCSNDVLVFQAATDRIDEQFLYYVLANKNFTEYSVQTSKGVKMPRGDKTALLLYELDVPSLSEQREIAAILGVLDDKIELNRKTAATLEEMARALYRSWFVDFDPVHAKAEGRAPAHMDTDTAALFPDKFNEDGLPDGWRSEPIIAQANWINGAAYKNMHFSNEGDALPVVKIAELKSGITGGTRFTATNLGQRYKIAKGDLLYSWSGNPDTSIDAFIWWLGSAWLNQHIFAVRENGSLSTPALFAMLKHFNGALAEIARNKQTTGLGHITRRDLEEFLVTIPTQPVLIAYDAVARPIHERYCVALYEIETLAVLRDTLLPRLMSGELRVPAALEMINEVA